MEREFLEMSLNFEISALTCHEASTGIFAQSNFLSWFLGTKLLNVNSVSDYVKNDFYNSSPRIYPVVTVLC